MCTKHTNNNNIMNIDNLNNITKQKYNFPVFGSFFSVHSAGSGCNAACAEVGVTSDAIWFCSDGP